MTQIPTSAIEAGRELLSHWMPDARSLADELRPQKQPDFPAIREDEIDSILLASNADGVWAAQILLRIDGRERILAAEAEQPILSLDAAAEEAFRLLVGVLSRRVRLS